LRKSNLAHPRKSVIPIEAEHLDDPEFKNYSLSELQEQFFLRALPERQGEYYYRARGLRNIRQMAVLFQSDKKIIASAILLDAKKFEEPLEVRGVSYKGALYFDVVSIRVFDPVTWETVSRIWAELQVNGPGRVKYNLNPSGYAEFEQELKGIKRPALPFMPGHDVPRNELPMRLRMEVSRLIRDTKLSREVKAIHDNKCQICGYCLELSTDTTYAEGHQPLGEEHNGPDVKENIICVCPNCHVKLDYNAFRITPRMLRLKESHNVAQHFIDYHNNQVDNAE
jgi:hypothetical protein